MLDFHRDVIVASYRHPVIVDFYAAWCGPCSMLGPVLGEVLKEAGGHLKLVKINTDENQDLAMKYGVSGIPDVRLFIDGRQAGNFIGLRHKGEIEQFLKDNLAAVKV